MRESRKSSARSRRSASTRSRSPAVTTPGSSCIRTDEAERSSFRRTAPFISRPTRHVTERSSPFPAASSASATFSARLARPARSPSTSGWFSSTTRVSASSIRSRRSETRSAITTSTVCVRRLPTFAPTPSRSAATSPTTILSAASRSRPLALCPTRTGITMSSRWCGRTGGSTAGWVSASAAIASAARKPPASMRAA